MKSEPSRRTIFAAAAGGFLTEAASAPAHQTKSGMVQVADSGSVKASQTIAAVLVTICPGGLRKVHWHPNAVTQNFNPGDIGHVRRTYRHYIDNADLSSHLADVSLSKCLAHPPRPLIAGIPTLTRRPLRACQAAGLWRFPFEASGAFRCAWRPHV